MRTIVFAPEASRALDDLLTWLEARHLPAGRRAAREIFATLDRLTEFPYSAPSAGDEHREAVVGFGRDGYIIRYTVTDDAIMVARIFHGRQDRR